VLVKSFVDEVVEDFSAIRPHDGLNMMAYEKIGEISVAKILRAFIGDEVLSGTDIGAGQFWGGLARHDRFLCQLAHPLPQNRECRMSRRDAV
jgi:hypothetical protein